MPQRLFAAPLFLLVALVSPAAVSTPKAASGSDTPTPFMIEGGPRTLGGGIQKAWRVKVDEDSAVQAIFKGGMWLPNGTGGRIYARYASHILHPDGSWTWIGKVATGHGEQSVVITFGKGAVFGRIPQGNDYPLRLQTEHGVVSLVRTSGAAISRSATAAAMRAKTDARAVPRPRDVAPGKAVPATAGAQTNGAVSTNASVVIDVMVAYTPGIVSEYGSQSAALVRINNLVDIANQAYLDSKVNQSIRLVSAVEVNYPDNTSDDSALDDITGHDSNGDSVPIPPSLSQIAGLRAKYGADLVSLLRKYDHATNGGCGLSWIIGGKENPIVPSDDYIYGYSVVGDGSDGGYYCLDTSFAHELGHNMGDAHDRANADDPGAYSYSYGYIGTGDGTHGFATIMAYGNPPQIPLAVFSNPNISTCQNTPCGVADSLSNSADNAHSMNNTAALIAQFEPTKVSFVHNDVDADGKSDLLLEYGQNSKFGYWILDGQKLVRTWSVATSSSYRVVATGDFNGDGYVDIAWSDPSSNIRMWFGNGSGFSMGHPVGTLPPAWRVVAAADVNGDGKSDLLLEGPNNVKFGYWIMNGSSIVRQWSVATSSAYNLVATGDFDGDGHLDIAWTGTQNDVRLWFGNGSTFSMGHPVGTAAAGWQVVGAGDVNDDGKADLLLQFTNNQRFGYWILNGQQLVRTWSVATSSAYKFVEAGDFNDDGILDVAWTSSQSDMRLWFGTGSSFDMGHPVANYAAGWAPLIDVPNSQTWK